MTESVSGLAQAAGRAGALAGRLVSRLAVQCNSTGASAKNKIQYQHGHSQGNSLHVYLRSELHYLNIRTKQELLNTHAKIANPVFQ